MALAAARDEVAAAEARATRRSGARRPSPTRRRRRCAAGRRRSGYCRCTPRTRQAPRLRPGRLRGQGRGLAPRRHQAAAAVHPAPCAARPRRQAAGHPARALMPGVVPHAADVWDAARADVGGGGEGARAARPQSAPLGGGAWSLRTKIGLTLLYLYKLRSLRLPSKADGPLRVIRSAAGACRRGPPAVVRTCSRRRVDRLAAERLELVVAHVREVELTLKDVDREPAEEVAAARLRAEDRHARVDASASANTTRNCRRRSKRPSGRSGCRHRTRASARSSASATSSLCRAAGASPSSSNWSSRCEPSSANRCAGLRWRAWSQIRRC